MWKKSLSLNVLPQAMFQWLGFVSGLVLSAIFIALGWGHFLTSPTMLGLFVVSIAANLIGGHFSQQVYKGEKLSVLLPYEYLSSIFTIVAAYLYFGNASFVSFCMALAACVTIVIFSLDGKKLVFPKNLGLVILVQALGSLRSLANGKMLLLLAAYLTQQNFSGSASVAFFTWNTIALSGALMVPMIWGKQFQTLTTGTKEFYKYRMTSAIIGQLNTILGFFVVAQFGVLLSSLLGFLSMGVRMVLGYFILGDKPDKKSVILSLILGSLVAIGFIWK